MTGLPEKPKAITVDPGLARELRECRVELDRARNLALELAGLWLGVELAEARGEGSGAQRARLAGKCRRLMLEDWT